MKKWILRTTISAVSLAVGAGISTAIILPLTLKARNTLSAFIPSGGEKNSLEGKDKIKYVALGDSETAGWNFLENKDYFSYADFLAQSFINAKRKVNYKNYAISGLRLSDFKKEIFQKPEIVNQLHDADLITITIGGNDILAYTKYLDIPFEIIVDFFANNNYQNILKIKEEDLPVKNFPLDHQDLTSMYENEKTFQKERRNIFQDVSFSWSKEESYLMVKNSFEKLINIFFNDKPQDFINIDQNWKDRLLSLIKREVATLTRDLHRASPNAQIIFLGHAMPFVQYSDAFINRPKENLNNLSVVQMYDNLLKQMKEAVKVTVGPANDFVDFYHVDEFQAFKEINKKIDLNNTENSLRSIAMPNLLDIHPSVLGHEKIGQGLFEILGKENGLTEQEIKTYFQKSMANNQNGILEDFERETITSSQINLASQLSTFVNLFDSDTGKTLIKSFASPIREKLESEYNILIKELESNLEDENVSEELQYQKAIYFMCKIVDKIMNLSGGISF